MNNVMYYVFAGFVAFGIAIGIPIGRWSVHCPVCPQIVPVSTTTTPGTPVKQPVLTSTGDTAGVQATTRPHVSYAVHDTTHDTITLSVAEPTVQDSQRCLQGNEQIGSYKLAWQICGTGIPAYVPRDLFKKFSLFRPDSIPYKTVTTNNVVIKQSRFALIVGPYIGVGYNAFDFAWKRPQINFGVCMAWGKKL